MTVPCTSCGALPGPDDVQCPRCGTLTSPRWGASVFAEAPTDAGLPDGQVPDDTVVERQASAPWSIPVREGSPSHGEPPVGDADPFRAMAVTVLAIAVCAALVAGVAALFDPGGGDDVATPAPAERQTQVLGDSVTAPSGSAVTSSSTTSTTSTSTTTSIATTSTTTTTTAPSSGDVPVLPASFRSGWVAQLTSVPTSAGSSALESAWQEVRDDVPEAVATRSDEWPSLRNGYWVLIEAGPFASGDEVDRFCASIGRSGDSCLPRMLSDRR